MLTIGGWTKPGKDRRDSTLSRGLAADLVGITLVANAGARLNVRPDAGLTAAAPNARVRDLMLSRLMVTVSSGGVSDWRSPI